jgi:hypothetical protein
MDVGDWLRSLVLGQYEAAFRDNVVDGAVLPKLAVDDLKAMARTAVLPEAALVGAVSALVRRSPLARQPTAPIRSGSSRAVDRR